MARRMFKWVVLPAAVAGAATVMMAEPAEFSRLYAEAQAVLARLGREVGANPVPLATAAGAFLATALYHQARGRTGRRATEPRTVVVHAPGEPAVVARAQARATRVQLIADQAGAQARLRKLPEEIKQAQRDVSYTGQAREQAEKTLAEREAAHEQAAGKLSGLHQEKARAESEVFEIEAALKAMA